MLIRHGESNVTVEQRIGGHRACTGLSPLGRKQAEALADRLRRTGELRATALVASTLRRAIETAEIIAPALGALAVQQDPRVCEHEPGDECDGMTYREFLDRYPYEEWPDEPYHRGFPGGETLADFHHRAAAALHDLAYRHHGGTVVIACHGGVIDVAMRSLLRLPATGAFDLYTLNTSITEFVRGERRWKLVRYNDAAHLAGLPAETPRRTETG